MPFPHPICMLFFSLFLFATTISAQTNLPTTFPILKPSHCSSNSDCPDRILSRCASDNTCQSCITNADCDHISFPGQCSGSRCIMPCSSTDYINCLGVRMICKASNCDQCASSSECTNKGYPTPVWCEMNTFSSNFCVNCRNNADCGSGWICQNGRCWQCSGDSDCPSNTPFCQQTFSKTSCKPCKNNDNSYCKSSTASKCVDMDCLGCTSALDCNHITGKPFCSSGKCVECADSTHCPSLEKSACDQGSNTCEVCSSNSDCTKFSSTQICAVDQGCVECTDSTHCTTLEKPWCNEDSNTCEASPIPTLSPEELEKIETLSTVGNATGVAATVAIMLANVLSPGDPGGISGGILAKMLQYVKYINVTYSLRLDAMFKSYHSSPGSLSFIAPKMPESVPVDFPSQQVPPRFAEYKVQSNFIVNFWDNMMSFLILTGVLLVIRAVEWIWRNKALKNSLRTKSRQIRTAVQNFLILEFYNIYCDVVLFFGLQATATDWSSSTSVLSFFVSVIMIALGLTLFFVHFITLYRYQKLRKIRAKGRRNRELERYIFKTEGIKTFFHTFKDDSFIRQAFLLVFTIRAALSNLVNVFLFEYPILQASLITSMTVIIFLYLVALRPFKSCINLAQQITYETLFLVSNACLLILTLTENSESYSESRRDNLCEIVIIVSLVFGFIPNLFVIAKIVSALLDLYRLRKATQKGPENVKETKSNLSEFNTKETPNKLRAIDSQVHRKERIIKLSPYSHQDIGPDLGNSTFILDGNSPRSRGMSQDITDYQPSPVLQERQLDSLVLERRPKIKRISRETSQEKKMNTKIYRRNLDNPISPQLGPNINNTSFANSSGIQLLNIESEFDYQKTGDQLHVTVLVNRESPKIAKRRTIRKESSPQNRVSPKRLDPPKERLFRDQIHKKTEKRAPY